MSVTLSARTGKELNLQMCGMFSSGPIIAGWQQYLQSIGINVAASGAAGVGAVFL
jgi:hypothetical protein